MNGVQDIQFAAGRPWLSQATTALNVYTPDVQAEVTVSVLADWNDKVPSTRRDE